MTREYALRCLYLLVLIVLDGCAAVEPRLDYEQAEQHIAEATGQARSYQPEEHQVAIQFVEGLLQNGLTADEAVQVCLLNNPGLQAAFFNIGVARAEVIQSGLLSNPMIGVSMRLPSGGGLVNLEADLAQNIVEFWQIPVRKRAAERNLNRTILEVAAQATDLAAKARAAYHRAIGADCRVDIARENLQVARRILELTTLRRDAGTGSGLDVNLARGVVLEAQLAVHETRLSSATARRSLASILGLTEDADGLTLVGALPEPPVHELTAGALVESALNERLDVRALREAILAAEDRLVLELRRVFPSVEIGVAVERGERERASGRKLLADTARSSIAAGRLAAPEIEPRSARRTNTELIIGPSLSFELPIFDQNQAQIARARYELEQSIRILEGLEQTIHQEVRGAVDRAQTAWEVARFYRDKIVPQAQESLDMSRESYHAGKTSILSVLDAERTYLSARARYAEALQAAAESVPELERTVGLPMDRLLGVDTSGPQDQASMQPINESATGPAGRDDEGASTSEGANP